MKEVILKTMEIEHFKGVQSQKIDFSHYIEICGDNGTGKSTINDAYMWCIFGKNAQGNVVSITPRDRENRIIPKVESRVKVVIEVDGILHTFERRQKQKWSLSKNGDEVFGGYSTERYIDNVPCGVSEFNSKLEEICKLEDWFMLTSIYAFMGMKQDDRRKILVKLAGEIDEIDILKDYPELEDMVYNTPMSINDIQIQKRLSLKKIDTELNEIPARIDELHKQIKDYDFDALEKTIKEIEDNIATISKEIDKTKSNGLLSKVEDLEKKLKNIVSEISDIEFSLKKERNRKEDEINSKINQAEADISISKGLIKTKENRLLELKNDIAKKEDAIQSLKASWVEENEKEFDIKANSVCPTCNRPYDNGSIDYLNSLQNEFYQKKELKLKSIQDEAVKVKELLVSLKKESVIIEDEIKDAQIKVIERESNLKEYTAQLNAIPTLEHALTANRERMKLIDECENIRQQINNTKMSSNAEAIEKELFLLDDSLNTNVSNLRAYKEQLMQKVINNNAKQRIKELENTSKLLSQDKVECKFILSQIDAFKKEKIRIVNEKVSSLFEIVTWKMYKPNVTNEGEKEICQALINGIPYEEQNTATKVNASVDIINGLSKALQLNVPMFIDNKESVTNKISSTSQIIALEVLKGQKSLTIKTY